MRRDFHCTRRKQRAAPERARNADEKRFGAWGSEPTTHPDHNPNNPKPYAQFSSAWGQEFVLRFGRLVHTPDFPKPCHSPQQLGITNYRRGALGIPLYPSDSARHFEHCSYCQACVALYREVVKELNPECIPEEGAGQ